MASTTTEKQPHLLQEIEPVAQEVLALLAPVCERAVIAGSIRRQKPYCSDIEIVAIPRYEQRSDVEHVGLFDDQPLPPIEVNLLDELVGGLLLDGVLGKRLDKNGRPSIGPKSKRLSYQDFALDLFIGSAENWGVLLAIRTGPASFAHAFVTNVGHMTRPAYAGAEHKPRPGLLPSGMRVGDGNQLFGPDGRLVATPTEEAFFEAIALPILEPWRRS